MASSDKKPKRFGAFLRLYGPLQARTHAKLVLAHEPRPDTPEAFHEELVEERRLEGIVFMSYGHTRPARLRVTLGHTS